MSIEDDAALVATLTPAQIECLRMVPIYGTSKAIAGKTGRAFKTVDNHLTAALEKLGVSDRHEAARKLAAVEMAASVNLPRQSPPLVEPPPPAILDVPERKAEDEDEPTFEIASDGRPTAWTLRLPISSPGESRNDLTTVERLTWVVLLAVGIPCTLGALAYGLRALLAVVLTVNRST
jgi:DNA-binding CsgD family transcriptional regulator